MFAYLRLRFRHAGQAGCHARCVPALFAGVEAGFTRSTSLIRCRSAVVSPGRCCIGPNIDNEGTFIKSLNLGPVSHRLREGRIEVWL